MTAYKFHKKRFSKKKSFLQLTLSPFLFWRELESTKDFFSQNEESKTNQADSFISIRYLWFQKLPASLTKRSGTSTETSSLQTFSFEEKRLSGVFQTRGQKDFLDTEITRNSRKKILFSSFFPHRKTFVYYWLFPVVGFVALTHFNQNQDRHLYSSLKTGSFLDQKSSAKSFNSYTRNTVHLKSKELNLYYQNLFETDHKEISDLWSHYFNKTQQNLFTLTYQNGSSDKKILSNNDFSNHLTFDSNWMDSILANHLWQRASFYWRWYSLPSSVCSNDFLKTNPINMISRPKKIGIDVNVKQIPSYFPTQDVENNPSFFTASTHDFIVRDKYSQSQDEPVQSYQKASFLLERLIRQMNTDPNSPLYKESFLYNCTGSLMETNTLNSSILTKMQLLLSNFQVPKRKDHSQRLSSKEDRIELSTSSFLKKRTWPKNFFFRRNSWYQFSFKKTWPGLRSVERIGKKFQVPNDYRNMKKIFSPKNFTTKYSKDSQRKEILVPKMRQKYKNATKSLESSIYELILLRKFNQSFQNMSFQKVEDQRKLGIFEKTENFGMSSRFQKKTGWKKEHFKMSGVQKISRMKWLNQLLENLMHHQNQNSFRFSSFNHIQKWQSPLLMSTNHSDSLLGLSSFGNFVSEKSLIGNSVSNANLPFEKGTNPVSTTSHFSLKKFDSFNKILSEPKNEFFYRLKFHSKMNEISQSIRTNHSESFLYQKPTLSLTPYEQGQNQQMWSLTMKENPSREQEKDLQEKPSLLSVNETFSNIKNHWQLKKTDFQGPLRFLNKKLSLLLKKEPLKLLDQHQLDRSLNSLINSRAYLENSNDISALNLQSLKEIEPFFYNLSNFSMKRNINMGQDQRPSILNHIRFKKKTRLKSFKKEYFVRNQETRKVEKIFRTYLSCKSVKNGENSFRSQNQTKISPYVVYTLTRLKNRLKSNFSSRQALFKNSYFLKQNSSFKDVNGNPTSKNQHSKTSYKRTVNGNYKDSYVSLVKHKNLAIPKVKSVENEHNDLLKKFNVKEKNQNVEQNHGSNPIRIYPSSLIRKMGFIFFHDITFSSLDFRSGSFSAEKEQKELLKSRVEPIKAETLFRIEKQKYMQKKRRRKKLKLENRRRKKRKRFYPRPKWLRFHLYNKFNRIRHFQKLSTNKFSPVSFHVKNEHNVILFKNQSNEQKFSFKEGRTKLSHIDSKTAYRKQQIRKTKGPGRQNFRRSLLNVDHQKLQLKIYRQNQQQWGFGSFNHSYNEKETMKKLPLTWEMPVFENDPLYQISNTVMSDFQRLCWKSYWLRSNLTPYIQRIQTSLKQMQKSESQWNSVNSLRMFVDDLLGFKTDSIAFQNSPSRTSLSKRKSTSLMWYLNMKNSFEQSNSLSNLSTFQQTQNVAEYDRILYDRISDVIKNVKNHLNVNGQSHARSFKRGRVKGLRAAPSRPSSAAPNEPGNKEQYVSNHFWSRLGRQMNPEIRAFSLFSSSIDSSFKPYGDLPTLRVLWALKQTNMLSFQPHNEIQNLWSNIKKREQNKSNKTKRFFSKSWKKVFSFVSNTSDNSKIQLINSYNPMNTEKDSNMWEHSTKFSQLCFKKVTSTDQKLQFFGISQKNYHEYLKHLKMQFKSKFSSNQTTLGETYELKSHLENGAIHLPEIATVSQMKQNQHMDPQKPFQNHSHFWWSTQSPNATLLWANSSLLSVESTNQSSSFLMTNVFWMCLTLFHLCSLFSLMRIPEIRSVMKFHLLIFYKIFNSYFIVIYYIYNVLNNQKKQIESMIHTFKKKRFFNPQTEMDSQKKYLSQSQFMKLEHNEFIGSYEKFSLNSYVSVWENFWYWSLSKDLLKSKIPLSKVDNSYSSLFEITLRFPFVSNLLLTKNQSMKSFDSENAQNFQIFFKQKNIAKIVFQQLLNTGLWSPLSLQKYRPVPVRNDFVHWISIKNTKIQSITSLLILFLAKFYVHLIYDSLNLCYSILLKIFDFIESVMFIIYKFLEKPAELMVEWIAQIFLVEWSSDVMSYVPESTDIYLWNSLKKCWRANRLFGFVGFLIERRLWCFFEIFMDSITKPDSDIITRQKKGIIFWDIWAEILIQAAEKYHINIPSLTTLREEQELLIEKLLDDKNWEWCQSSMTQLTPLIQVVHTTRPFSWNKSTVIDMFHSKINDLQQKNHSTLVTSSFLKKRTVKRISFQEILVTSQRKYRNLKTFKNFRTFWGSDFQNKIPRMTEVETSSKVQEIWRRWSVNQYFTSQGVDTDLFVDLHLPLSFSHMATLKYYEPIQPTLGSLVCQIYSGLFSKQISKNILVVGAPGTGKGLLIQALAGETESKMISDHAHRYAHVQRGVAVGMKMLRDVFDAIALHTPCFFLIEDIHLIGERRPMLISDDENAKATEQSFVGDNEEVHEKNQMIYQLNRHSIAHYKRPYKGDFSLLIPSNHFCFDLFLGVTTPRIRKAGVSPLSPLPMDAIEKQLNHTNDNEKNGFHNDSVESSNLTSHLQFVSEKLFAPPATSPFTILVMKEQKKLKPRKLVKEMPWGGLSWDQMMLVPKVTYSIRVKVALLADIAISHLSVKLDMITDLLVIMDSVRSNRGFVVFATTHIPYILDPALRRPGRLDETISLPIFPNFLNRLQIFKTNLSNFSSTLDFVDYSHLLSNLNETEISSLISKTKLLLLHSNSMKKSHKAPIYSFNQAMKFKVHSEIVQPSKVMKRQRNAEKRKNSSFLGNSKSKTPVSELSLIKNFHFYPSIAPGSSNIIGLTYFQVSTFLMNSQFADPTQSNFILWSKFSGSMRNEQSIFRELYSSTFDFQNHLLLLFAGKVGEFFIFNNHSLCRYSALNSKLDSQSGTLNTSTNWWNSLQTYHHSGLWSLAGIDEFWQSATTFVFSLVQKRFLYNQNLLLSRMLDFDDISTLKEPPSPPGSSILMPAKKYENFQRTARDFQEKSIFSIHEKIQMHQQQRLIKKLYDKPVSEDFRSEMISNRLTSFHSCFKELGYLDSFLRRPSSVNSYYTNRIVTRHKFSLMNQWWNGQLEEHNAETTFLSDVDWRSMFVESLGDLVIDFPDSDQHYNPRHRRWFLQSSYSGYWYTFDKMIPYEIYSHFMIQSFNKAYNLLDNEREILDFLAFVYLKKGVLKEIDNVTIKSRFYSKNSQFLAPSSTTPTNA